MKKNLSVLAVALLLCLVCVGVSLAEDHTHAFVNVWDASQTKFPASFEAAASEGQVVAPTCTEDGYAVRICDICGAYDESQKYIKVYALGHDFTETEPEITLEPTCTETGLKEVKTVCKRCGYVDHTATYDIPAKGHVWAEELAKVTAKTPKEGEEPEVVEKAATCTEAGQEAQAIFCTVCGVEKEGSRVWVKTSEGPKGHTPAEPVQENVVEPTCVAIGTYDEVTYCEVCHVELKREKKQNTELAEHKKPEKPTIENFKEATCKDLATWEEAYYCTVCGEEAWDRVYVTDPEAKYADHTWVEDKDNPKTVQPTCYSVGTGYYYCAVCGVENEKDTFEIPKLPHTYGEVKEIPATCVAQGGKVRECTVKDCPATAEGHFDYIEVYPINPDAHNWQLVPEGEESDPVGSHSRAATCTKNGVNAYVCTLCGARYAEEIPALGHETVVVEAIAPTCVDVGFTAGLACTREDCDGKEAKYPKDYPSDNQAKDEKTGRLYKLLTAPKEVPANGHVALDTIDTTHDATCTEDGYVTYKCAVCGLNYNVDVKAKGHDYVLKGEDQEADCINGGYTTLVCSRCGDEKRVEIPATGAHEWSEYITEPANCKNAGRIYRYCYVCFKEEVQEFLPIDVNAHEWYQDWSDVKKYPTCTEEGTGKWVCAVCGAEKYDVYPANGHSPIIIEGTAPTCTEPGLSDGLYCPICDTTLEEQVVVPATGHTWDEGEVVKEATTTEEGEIKYTCIVCGETKTEVIAKVVEPKGGLVLDDDGVWRYYVDGVFDEKMTGIVDYEGGSFFVADGVMCSKANGLNEYPAGTWYFLSNGQIQKQYSGLALYDGEWFYIVNGRLDDSLYGLVSFQGGQFLISKGMILSAANGLWMDNDGTWYYLENGQVATWFSGTVAYQGANFNVKNGRLN